jgi:hypothetical protein
MTTTFQQSTSGTGDLVAIDALGPAGAYRTPAREVIRDTAGAAVAELSMVQLPYISRTIGAQRKMRPLPVAQRRTALHKAAEIFANSVIAGLDFEQYVALASRTSGLPISVTCAGAHDVAAALITAFDAVWPAKPSGAAFDWREERTRTSGTALSGQGFALCDVVASPVIATPTFAKRERLAKLRAALGYRTTDAEGLPSLAVMQLCHQLWSPTHAGSPGCTRGEPISTFSRPMRLGSSRLPPNVAYSPTVDKYYDHWASGVDIGLLLGNPRRRWVKHRGWEDI